MSRIFLAIVGLVYILLAGWCALLPARTSKGVGFELQPGQGQSEFLTVYGGLQLGLGLVFLWPLYRPEEAFLPLLVCAAVHGCLVLFRSAAFFLYTDFMSTTYCLAATEWILFLASAVLIWRQPS